MGSFSKTDSCYAARPRHPGWVRLAHVSQRAKVGQIRSERIPLATFQRIVLHYVLEIVDSRIQLALIEVIASQLAIEFREMMLHIFVPYPLFFVGASELRRVPQVLLNSIDHIPGPAEVLAERNWAEGNQAGPRSRTVRQGL
jgi:hypothetical protein